MNVLKTGALCVLLNAMAWGAIAQNKPPLTEPDPNKPKIFADLPQRFTVDAELLKSLLDLSIGEKVALPLANNVRYQGEVVSKSDGSDKNVKSVVIRSTNRHGAVFTFTRVRNEDDSFTYSGRMLSLKHGDAFELAQEAGQYVLVKKDFYDLINE